MQYYLLSMLSTSNFSNSVINHCLIIIYSTNVAVGLKKMAQRRYGPVLAKQKSIYDLQKAFVCFLFLYKSNWT